MADRCVKDYAEGGGAIVRVPFDQIGALWLNRKGLPVSGKYVHNRWRSIMEKHGFSVKRYQYMILVRCNRPEHRRKLREHNERFCHQDPLLPNVSSDMVLGSISKTHLAYGFKCIKDGVCWDHSGQPMVPAGPSKEAIQDHIENGIFAIILDGRVLDENPEGVDAIMVSENLDNDQSLPEHEMALLKHVRCTIIEICASSGKRMHAKNSAELWPQVKKKVAETLGGRWAVDDIAAAYNLAMVLDDKTLSVLVDTHQLYINPTMVIIRLSFVNAVAQINHLYRQVKLSLIVAQYLCDKKKYEKQGKMFIASLIPDKAVLVLAKLEEGLLLPYEKFVDDMMSHYNIEKQMQDTSLVGTYMAAKANLYARVGKALYEHGSALAGGSAASANFGPIEAKFIAFLHEKLPSSEVSNLPSPMLKGEAEETLNSILESKRKQNVEEQTVKPIQLSRPVKWAENGEVEKTVEYEAECKGFHAGGSVTLLKKSKIGPEGRHGILKALSRVKGCICADIEWDECEDFPSEAVVKLDALKPCDERPKAKKAKTEKVHSRVISEEVVPYVAFDGTDATENLSHLAKAAIWTLYLKSGVTSDQVQLRGDKEKPSEIQAVAGQDFVQHALWLLPWNAEQPCTSKEQNHAKATTVEFSFAGEVETCWVPARCRGFRGGDDDEDSVVAPYWAVDFAKAEEKPNMDLKPVTIKLGKLGEVSGLSSNALKLSAQAGPQGNGLLTIYALTNTKRVKAGEVLLRKKH